MSDVPDPPPDSLRERAIRSAKWVTIGRIVCEGASFLAMIALARLLTPAEVGHAAVAIVVFALATGFLAGSFGSPLVRASELRDAQVEVAAFLSVACGVALTVVSLLVALALSPVLGATTAAMLALASPSFLFASISAIPQALRSRRLAFKALMIIEMVASLAGSSIAVLLAALGIGSAAMVLGGLALAGATAALSLVRSDARWPRWHRSEVKEILGFGLPASAAGLFFTAVRNIDYALIAGRMPAAQVGFYYRAYTLAVDYQMKVSNIVVRILFPLLARTESTAAFRAARSRVVRLHSVALFPLLAMLIVTAPDLVPLLYGDAWSDAITPTQILVGAGFAAAVGTGIGPMMLAAGRPGALLINNMVSFACFALTVFVCAGYGLIATCIGVAAYRLVALVVSQYFLATRLLGIPLRETLIFDPGPAVVSAAAAVLAALPVSTLLASYPAAIGVAVTGAIGICVYGAVLRTLFMGAWSDARMVLVSIAPYRLRRALRGALGPSRARRA